MNNKFTLEYLNTRLAFKEAEKKLIDQMLVEDVRRLDVSDKEFIVLTTTYDWKYSDKTIKIVKDIFELKKEERDKNIAISSNKKFKVGLWTKHDTENTPE